MTKETSIGGINVVLDPALPENEARFVDPSGKTIGTIINLGKSAHETSAERELDISRAVSTEMRQAAVAYYKQLYPSCAVIPIGLINGIIYAALSKSPFVERMIEASDVE